MSFQYDGKAARWLPVGQFDESGKPLWPKAKADPPKPKAAAAKAAPAAASPAAASQNPFKKCFARCCVPKPQQ